MNTSNGPVRPTPSVLNPPDDICFQLSVPNDPEWIAAFYDALYQLTLWMAWARDDAHTGKDIAARWWKTLNSVQLCREVQAPSGCPDPGEDYLLRQNPDNPCLIETSADGTHWCTLIDISLCTPATGQPGNGADQPASGGGEACYKGTLNAAQTWLLPTVVNAGDVLTFSNVQGAGTDGSGHWYCPDGSIFFAGACVGSLSFDGGDPAPAIHHMAIIAKIGAVYYDITAGPITVPGGTTNAPVTLQVNDTPLTDNSGDYKFDVCATNNQSGDWTSIMLLSVNPYGFVVVPTDGGGVWTAGGGWDAVDVSLGINCYNVIAIKKTFTPATITSIKYEAAIVLGSNYSGVAQQLVWYAPARTVLTTVANAASSDLAVLWTGSQVMDNFQVNGAAGWTPGVVCGTGGGSERVFKITVTGTGPKPPEFP